MKDVTLKKKCRICHSNNLYKFLDLSSMPIPNGFLKKEKLKDQESYYDLACQYCIDCGLVQLTNVVNPEIMFRDYLYIPSTAKMMMNNFSNLVYQANRMHKLSTSSLVADIGSNDGSLLRFFKSFGAKVLGIDPAENLAKIANEQGIPTEPLLFNTKTALKMKQKYGQADIVTATNVIAHIDDLHGVWGGISNFLAEDGLFITEFPYLLDLISKNQFDTIYHEHLSYFSLKPWKKIVEEYGFKIINAERRLIHGGSIRLTHKRRKNKKNKHARNAEYLILLEEKFGLYKPEAFEQFSKRVMGLKDQLLSLLTNLKSKNKKIVGYGAAAKGNVLTNFFGINSKILDFIVDSTPYKHGLFTPGTHIPIYPESKIEEFSPDYLLILAWNFADEIMEKQKKYKKRGGHFIIPIPKVEVI